jgi:hypothetical protein
MPANLYGYHAPMMRICYILTMKIQKLPDWVMVAQDLINQVFEKCLPLTISFRKPQPDVGQPASIIIPKGAR